PFDEFGLLVRRQRRGILLIRRKDDLTELRQPALDRRIGQRGLYGAVEPGDDVGRRSFGGPQPVPERQADAGGAGFNRGRDVGQFRPALGVEHGERLELVRRYIRQRRRGLETRQV